MADWCNILNSSSIQTELLLQYTFAHSLLSLSIECCWRSLCSLNDVILRGLCTCVGVPLCRKDFLSNYVVTDASFTAKNYFVQKS